MRKTYPTGKWLSALGLLAMVLLAVVVAPATGALLAGHNLSRYLEFPPVSQHLQHHASFWPVFVILAIAEFAIVLPFVWSWWRNGTRSHGSMPDSTAINGLNPGTAARHQLLAQRRRHGFTTRGRFPGWGWLGVACCGAGWLLAWTRIPFLHVVQHLTYIPLWYGYILVVNALSERFHGGSMLRIAPRRFLLLFPVSAVFWWSFEYLNRFVENWHYPGAERYTPVEYLVLATISFATVLPAVAGTAWLLAGCRRLQAPFHHGLRLPQVSRSLTITLLLVAGLPGLLLISVYPQQLFPLLWLAPLLLLLVATVIARCATPFSSLLNGDWRSMVTWALAALICGCFWEMWNYLSLARWVYTIPYVPGGKIFEMPILGYAGYLPFGLECAVVVCLLAPELSGVIENGAESQCGSS